MANIVEDEESVNSFLSTSDVMLSEEEPFNDDVPELYESDEYDSMDEKSIQSEDYDSSSDYEPNQPNCNRNPFCNDNYYICVCEEEIDHFEVETCCKDCNLHWCWTCAQNLEQFNLNKYKCSSCNKIIKRI